MCLYTLHGTGVRQFHHVSAQGTPRRWAAESRAKHRRPANRCRFGSLKRQIEISIDLLGKEKWIFHQGPKNLTKSMDNNG